MEELFNQLNGRAVVLSRDDIRPRTLEEMFAYEAIIKADALPLVVDHVAGSYEAGLARIRDAVFRGCGCSRKATHNASGALDITPDDGPIVQNPHALSIVETFPGYAFVRCDDEDTVWRVPFQVDDSGAVTTGQYEEVAETFEPIGGADAAKAQGGATMKIVGQDLFPARPIRKVYGVTDSGDVSAFMPTDESGLLLLLDQTDKTLVGLMDELRAIRMGMVSMMTPDAKVLAEATGQKLTKEIGRTEELKLTIGKSLYAMRSERGSSANIAKREGSADAELAKLYMIQDNVIANRTVLSEGVSKELRLAISSREIELGVRGR